jgi:hypothetical protein
MIQKRGQMRAHHSIALLSALLDSLLSNVDMVEDGVAKTSCSLPSLSFPFLTFIDAYQIR